MKFSEEQIQQIKQWTVNLNSISELQDAINKTFNEHLTYMDVRFLLDDLNINLQKTEESVPEPKQDENEELPAEGELVDEGATVSVTVDPVTRPGCVVNGSVRFSDGESATWKLDELGRLALKPSKAGYRPSSEDVAKFQEALQKQLNSFGNSRGLGF